MPTPVVGYLENNDCTQQFGIIVAFMKMIQLCFEEFTLVIYPQWGLKGLVHYIPVANYPSETFTIPQLVAVINNVLEAKSKA